MVSKVAKKELKSDVKKVKKLTPKELALTKKVPKKKGKKG
jgi:hypothetical protein